MCPGLRIVVIVVVVGDARMKYLPSCQGLVSILLEVLRHGHNIWKVDPGLVVVVVASDGVGSPPCQKRRPTRTTEGNLSETLHRNSTFGQESIKPGCMLLSELDFELPDCQDLG